MCEKNKGTTECDKSIVHVMLVLHNVKMVSSNVRKKKIKELPNVTKVQSHVMLELHNVMMVLSYVKK